MNTNELLWKYLDGKCDAEEMARVEQLLATDKGFKKEWAERARLHRALQESIELEKPSMRFTLNVMDRLPGIRKKLSIAPLINPFWQKILGLSSIAGFLAFLILVSQAPGFSAASSTMWSPRIESFVGAFQSLPAQLMSIVAGLSLCYILLLIVDQQLKKKFSKGSGAVE